MGNTYFAKNAIFVAAFFLFNLIGSAQPARPDLNRASDIDVKHYSIRISFDRAKKRVIGDTIVTLSPVSQNLTQVVLDSVGIDYSSVTLDKSSTPLKFRGQAGRVIVDLDRPYSPRDTISIRFQYSANPKKGIYFVPEQKPAENWPGHSAQIWTQGEAEEARHWLPSFDFPSDKATTEQFITANANETVIGNGTLLEKATNPDGTVTHHFKMDIPYSTYLISFVIGEYSQVSEKYKEIPLGYFVYPGTESIVPKAYGKTADMMRVFEDLTKIDFPFNKYDQTIVSAFQFGGMENITATTMADSEIFFVNNPLFAGNVENLVSHELAHSWFGNLVTCKNWAELWLNEGFATFMEAAYRERAYGRKAYIYKIRSDAEQFLAEDAVSSKRHGLFNRNASNVDSLFDRAGTTYNKGGAVIHTLREQIGDEAFWKGVNLYLTRHRFGSVESTDLEAAMEESSGTKLDWFFDQWVYGIGSPKIVVRQSYQAAAKTLVLAVSQTQKPDKLVSAAFRLPIDLEIKTLRGDVTEKIELTKRVATFRLKVPARPTQVIFDKDDKIPIKSLKVHPLNQGK